MHDFNQYSISPSFSLSFYLLPRVILIRRLRVVLWRRCRDKYKIETCKIFKIFWILFQTQ